MQKATDFSVPAVFFVSLAAAVCVLCSQDDGEHRREHEDEEKRPVGYEDMKERYESLQKAYKSLKAAHGEVCHAC